MILPAGVSSSAQSIACNRIQHSANAAWAKTGWLGRITGSYGNSIHDQQPPIAFVRGNVSGVSRRYTRRSRTWMPGGLVRSKRPRMVASVQR